MGELIKVKDMAVGQFVSTSLLVLGATARKTKASKPYLSLELFDGVEKINGNYWDWKGANIPAVSSVLDVSAQVTEWAGAKQLNISSISTSEAYSSVSFMPMSDYDLGAVWTGAKELIDSITDEFLKTLVEHIFSDLKELWMESPSAKGIHHAYVGGNLVHSLSVATIAKAIASTVQDANIDLCIAGGLLHDLGKLFSYAYEGAAITMTDEGILYGHLHIGAEFVGNYVDTLGLSTADNDKKTELLRHIIASHHGKLEHGAIVLPSCIEAHIVHHADALDATIEQIAELSERHPENKWTERIFTAGNVPHINSNYTRFLFFKS